MDSSSSPASSSSAAAPESRPQAGPLPRKRGEIGWNEELKTPVEESSSAAPLPERHPEDRDAAATTDSTAPASGSTTAPASPSLTTLPTSSTDSLSKKRRILGFLHPKKVPSYGGLRLTTLVAFAIQVFLVAGTIVGWYFSVSRLSKSGSASSNSNSNGQGQQPSLGNASTAIFIHVVFGVVTLVQLLFLERRVFRLRAERYSYLHPGEILPSARRRQLADTSLGFSPWNRPPLPTYAAALAQSGVGTGDVEDHLIAAPPPPAYGNTRGSTFLLSGFLRDSLRAQRPVSAQTTASQNTPMGERSERPISYRSVDEEWEVVQNAERARQLEETLATLERPAPAHTAQ
ncbi:hypothetical protein MVEN_02106800 [Mycena venus]|uniref:Uncharacterized protein n=1 Tax=Mycena venus TaxID=2733690 RepID=A0A8H7CIK9_9AGAR|nr:hypothetical protein MVEN_02106800 [Mycena venus]